MLTNLTQAHKGSICKYIKQPHMFSNQITEREFLKVFKNKLLAITNGVNIFSSVNKIC
jgi:hypothetical protein